MKKPGREGSPRTPDTGAEIGGFCSRVGAERFLFTVISISLLIRSQTTFCASLPHLLLAAAGSIGLFIEAL